MLSLYKSFESVNISLTSLFNISIIINWHSVHWQRKQEIYLYLYLFFCLKINRNSVNLINVKIFIFCLWVAFCVCLFKPIGSGKERHLVVIWSQDNRNVWYDTFSFLKICIISDTFAIRLFNLFHEKFSIRIWKCWVYHILGFSKNVFVAKLVVKLQLHSYMKSERTFQLYLPLQSNDSVAMAAIRWWCAFDFSLRPNKLIKNFMTIVRMNEKYNNILKLNHFILKNINKIKIL